MWKLGLSLKNSGQSPATDVINYIPEWDQELRVSNVTAGESRIEYIPLGTEPDDLLFEDVDESFARFTTKPNVRFVDAFGDKETISELFTERVRLVKREMVRLRRSREYVVKVTGVSKDHPNGD